MDQCCTCTNISWSPKKFQSGFNSCISLRIFFSPSTFFFNSKPSASLFHRTRAQRMSTLSPHINVRWAMLRWRNGPIFFIYIRLKPNNLICFPADHETLQDWLFGDHEQKAFLCYWSGKFVYCRKSHNVGFCHQYNLLTNGFCLYLICLFLARWIAGVPLFF